MSDVRERARAPVAALRGVGGNAGLRRLLLAYTGSEMGAWVGMIALSVLSYGDSGLGGVGLVLGLRMLAPTVAAPFMGVLADRLPRRRVMVAADLVRLVLMLVATGVVWADGPLLAVLVLLALVSVATTAFRPAEAAIVPGLARTPDELTAANAVSSTVESVSSFAGPALGGVLVAVSSVEVAFLVTAATFAWSALLLAGIAEPARDTATGDGDGTATGSSVMAELTVGARTLVEDRAVGLLVGLMGAQVLVSAVFLVLTAGLAFDSLDGDEELFGVLLSAVGVGGVVGAALAVGLVGSNLVRSFAVGVVLWGAPIALLGVWQSVPVALVLIGVIGLANTLVDVAGFTLLQRAVPDEVLARVFGILESVMYGTTALGALVGAPLVSLLGLEWALVATGLFLPALAALTWPLLRGLELAEAPAVADRAALLGGVPFLAALPALTLEHLAGSLQERTVPAGDVVVEQGERGEGFFVVADGTVRVVVDGEPVREEGAGAFFGEIALLRDTPRTATVVARDDVSLLVLGRDEFLSAVTGHVASAEAADAVVAARLGAYRPALLRL